MFKFALISALLSLGLAQYQDQSNEAQRVEQQKDEQPYGQQNYGQQSSRQVDNYGQQSYGNQKQSYGNNYQDEHPKPEPYQFDYKVDDYYGNSHYHKEEADDYGTRKGSYGYRDAYGVYRYVEYIADKDGFRAEVKTNEPGTTDDDPADVDMQAKEPPAQVNAGSSYKQASYGNQAQAGYSKQSSSSYGKSQQNTYAQPQQQEYEQLREDYSPNKGQSQSLSSSSYSQQQSSYAQGPSKQSNGYQQPQSYQKIQFFLPKKSYQQQQPQYKMASQYQPPQQQYQAPKQQYQPQQQKSKYQAPQRQQEYRAPQQQMYQSQEQDLPVYRDEGQEKELDSQQLAIPVLSFESAQEYQRPERREFSQPQMKSRVQKYQPFQQEPIEQLKEYDSPSRMTFKPMRAPIHQVMKQLLQQQDSYMIPYKVSQPKHASSIKAPLVTYAERATGY